MHVVKPRYVTVEGKFEKKPFMKNKEVYSDQGTSELRSNDLNLLPFTLQNGMATHHKFK